MRIIRDRAVVDDHWRHVPDESEGLPCGDVIVGLARWRREGQALRARGSRLGVRLAPGDRVDDIAGDLGELDVVALEFSGFAEGRGYSQARLLRDKLGYRGEIRAVGDVSRDRLAFMARCGVDAFELRDEDRLDEALAAFDEIGVAYQRGSDDRGLADARSARRAATGNESSACD